jgi:hypothetical protein
MKLPPLVFVLGFAGLVPFLAAPLWITVSAESAPPWLDHLWLTYGALVASFMAGTFWGFSAFASQGTQGMVGLVVASALMLITWAATALPFRAAAIALAGVYVVQLLAEIWRERALDTLPGYFRLRAQLTIGVIVAIGWRLLLP